MVGLLLDTAASGAPGHSVHGLDIAVLVAYFIGITVFGAWFGRFTTSTKDFFMAGQRFPAWLVAFSCVATLVGSYSFVKYSETGFTYGLASSQTYFNDWFWMPLWMFGWLPILYFAGIVTVPTYFKLRFDGRVRLAATAILLLYLIGYIGINLYTLGTALTGVFGLDPSWIIWFAALVAALCMAYEFTGGQTSVIFTDLLQGLLLLVVGLGLFLAGVYWVGGFERFWELLPEGHGRALPPLNDDPGFNFVGIFWQDGLAGGLAFYFMNQGMLLRFLSARSVHTARKAAGWVILVMMPLTAIAVAGAGWVGRAMVNNGDLPPDTVPRDAFIDVAALMCQPGMFGFVIAALLAALMSTADTLINASSSILVNDFYKPLLVKNRDDQHYLKVAHWTSLGAAALGVSLVPVYMAQGTIYEAHGTFVAAITPPMAVAIFFAFLWPRFNTPGALATLVGGILLMSASVVWPVLIAPFDHGIDPAGGYKYIRACYGVAVSAGLGIAVTLLTTPPDPERIRGLTLWTCRQQISSTPTRKPRKVHTRVRAPGHALVRAAGETLEHAEAHTLEHAEAHTLEHAEVGPATDTSTDAAEWPEIPLDPASRHALCVEPGDVVFVDDARWWLGGLRSTRFRVGVGDGADPLDLGLPLPAAALDKNNWNAGHRIVLSRVD